MFQSWTSRFKNFESLCTWNQAVEDFFSSLQKATNVRLQAATDRVTWQDCIHITEGNYVHFMSGNVYEFLRVMMLILWTLKWNFGIDIFRVLFSACQDAQGRIKLLQKVSEAIPSTYFFVIMFRSGRSRSFCTCVITAYNSSCLSFEHLSLLLWFALFAG